MQLSAMDSMMVDMNRILSKLSTKAEHSAELHADLEEVRSSLRAGADCACGSDRRAAWQRKPNKRNKPCASNCRD